MTARLDGTLAVVTGASGGIGAATARALAAEGASLALLARRRDRLDELAAELGGAGVYEVDITDADAAQATIDRVVADAGRLDVLVNSAGYLANSLALDADLDQWHRTIDVNVGGVLNVTHAALPHLVDAATGPRGVADLVSISSLAGRRVLSPESNVYSASKYAVVGFTEALRQELAGRQVRAGVVEPGMVRTEMTTAGAPNAPDATKGSPLEAGDIAEAVVYMVTRPAHTAVNEIAIRPTEQVH